MNLNFIKDRYIILSLLADLSPSEKRELKECKKILKKHYEDKAWQLARIMNLSYVARETKDWDWMKSIGVELDQMKG